MTPISKQLSVRRWAFLLAYMSLAASVLAEELDTPITATEVELPFRETYSGKRSDIIGHSILVARSRAQIEDLLRRHDPDDPEPPVVTLEEGETLVAFYFGPLSDGGHSRWIERVVARGRIVRIFVKAGRLSGDGCMTTMTVIHPFQWIAVRDLPSWRSFEVEIEPYEYGCK